MFDLMDVRVTIGCAPCSTIATLRLRTSSLHPNSPDIFLFDLEPDPGTVACPHMVQQLGQMGGVVGLTPAAYLFLQPRLHGPAAPVPTPYIPTSAPKAGGRADVGGLDDYDLLPDA